MRILVLDTIHGGQAIADELVAAGHGVDCVDVYRGEIGISPEDAVHNKYDLIIRPVHLDPCYPLLRSLVAPVITHHEAVRWILGRLPNLTVEITGSRGKTTTASALAYLLSSFRSSGILLTSRGVCRYPDNAVVTKVSITPASLLIARKHLPDDGWFVCETSLGICGVGSLAILTSADDYPVAAGRLRALDLKLKSTFLSPQLLLAPGIVSSHDNAVQVSDLVKVHDTTLLFRYRGRSGSFENPLLALDGYRVSLMLASAAGLLLGYDPGILSGFTGVSGRMQVREEEGKTIVDNANSGISSRTTIEASQYARSMTSGGIVLVVGQEEHAVCENFAVNDILEAVLEILPEELILVTGGLKDAGAIPYICHNQKIPVKTAASLAEGTQMAKRSSHQTIVLSVKTWR